MSKPARQLQIVVTGASSGIGNAVAATLASRGHRIIAVARDAARLERLQRDYGDSYGDHDGENDGEYDNHSNRIHTIAADLSTAHGQAAVARHVKSIGPIDGIVHAAGSAVALNHYQDLDAETLINDFKTHVATPIALNNALREELRGGRILFIDSYSANSPRVGWAGYSIVKAAAQMAACSATAEISIATIIRVFPGAVRTPLVDAVLSAKQQSPVVDVFKALDASGKISDALPVGEFIADILITASAEQLSMREYWEFDNPDDRIF